MSKIPYVNCFIRFETEEALHSVIKNFTDTLPLPIFKGPGTYHVVVVQDTITMCDKVHDFIYESDEFNMLVMKHEELLNPDIMQKAQLVADLIRKGKNDCPEDVSFDDYMNKNAGQLWEEDWDIYIQQEKDRKKLERLFYDPQRNINE